MAFSHPDSVLLTPIDNLFPRKYTKIVLYFPTSGSDVATVVQRLRLGLTQTLERIPFLAGTVKAVRHGTQKGMLAITAPWKRVDQIFTVKDLTQVIFPDYQSLQSQQFPMLESSSDLMPSLPIDDTVGRPAMLAQINLIKGGMALSVCSHHSVVDGTSNAFVHEMWAACCRGEVASQFVSINVIHRERLMQGSELARLDDFPEFVYVPEAPISGTLNSSRNIFSRIHCVYQTWILATFRFILGSNFNQSKSLLNGSIAAKTEGRTKTARPSDQAAQIFFFTKAKLKELKEAASKEKGEEGSCWISTTDALSSLLWCSITAARNAQDPTDNASAVVRTDRRKFLDHWVASGHLLGGGAPTGETFAILAVLMNGRRLLHPPLTTSYIGNVLMLAAIAAPVSSIVSTMKTVAESAHLIRQRLNDMDGERLRRMVGALKSVPDNSRVTVTGGPIPGFYLAIISWSTQGWYDMDWGSVVGGKPERLRCCKPIEPNCCVIMPALGTQGRNEDSEGWEVIINLEKKYMEQLKNDKLFSQFARWR